MDWIWIWVAVVVISLVIEFITLEMVSVWTAIGGMICILLAALDVALEVQLIVFFVVSITLLLLLRKIAIKYLLKNNNAKIGTGLIVGSTQRLLTPITRDDLGTLKINGVTWSVTTLDGSCIPSNSLVEILEIKGNKLIVKKVEEKENK